MSNRTSSHQTTLERVWKGKIIKKFVGWQWSCTCGVSGFTLSQVENFNIYHAPTTPPATGANNG